MTDALELRIGFKYDHDAYRFYDCLSQFKIPHLPDIGEQKRAKILITETFAIIAKSKENELKDLLKVNGDINKSSITKSVIADSSTSTKSKEEYGEKHRRDSKFDQSSSGRSK